MMPHGVAIAQWVWSGPAHRLQKKFAPTSGELLSVISYDW
jgi:hypothetical protein